MNSLHFRTRLVVAAKLVACVLFQGAAHAQLDDPAWRMLHHDERHTGHAPGIAKFATNVPPTLRWIMQPFAPVSSNTLCGYRFYSGFVLANFEGKGQLAVAATGPDDTAGITCGAGSVPGLTNGRVCAIRSTGNLGAEFLWNKAIGTVLNTTNARVNWGSSDWFDQYSAVAINCDSDPGLDLVFTSKGGTVRAVSGQTGDLIWEYQTQRFIEAGPMLADLDRDGTEEIIVLTGDKYTEYGNTNCPALLVFRPKPFDGAHTNEPIISLSFPQKLDSNEPGIVDLDPISKRVSKTIVFGSWCANCGAAAGCPGGCNNEPDSGYLYAVWFDLESGGKALTNATAHVNCISLRQIREDTHDPILPGVDDKPIMRSSPLLWDFGEGETAVFGWMGNYAYIESSRISAVGLAYRDEANPSNRRVEFFPRWTRQNVQVELNGTITNWPVMDWKASVALLPVPGQPPLIVSAGGKGVNGSGQTASYGLCDPAGTRGWVGAFDRHGSNVWSKVFTNEGNVRASCAVADLDGDGHNEMVVAFGCHGQVRCYSGETGEERWRYQLGTADEWTQRSIGSPSIGDVDGDGRLEVIVSAFDGRIYCLDGYDFRITSVRFNASKHIVLRWNSYGGTRYRVEYNDGDANGNLPGAFVDLPASADLVDPRPWATASYLEFTDDFTLTGGPPPKGRRFYRVREIP